MNFIPFYMFVLYCVFKKSFLQKYLKAISKVHVKFNELQRKFKCNSQKMVFTDFTTNYVLLTEKWNLIKWKVSVATVQAYFQKR